MGQNAIEVSNVSKIYKLYNKQTDRFKELFTRKQLHTDFKAVDNLNFTVKKGESLGIVGKNGSGKSTLLKMITGVLTPTSGSIKVDGKISALLELGAGFNGEYSGIENIYLQGTLMGYSKEEMDKRVDEIVEFADIGEHINQPVKTYSSGMFVRLAFAVAISVDPEILIVDEALSVGDIRFQRKCFRKIEEFKKDRTFIFVSHDLGTITKFCDRVIWINEGVMKREGDPNEVTKEFRAFMIEAKYQEHRQKSNEKVKFLKEKGNNQYEFDPILNDVEVMGDKKAEFLGTLLLDNNEEKCSSVNANEKCSLLFRIKVNEDIHEAIIGFTVKDRLGSIVFQTNTFVIDQFFDLEGNRTYDVRFDFTMPKLIDGYYTISPAIASGTMSYHVQHCWLFDVMVIQVLNNQNINLEGFVYVDDVNFKLD